MAVCPGFDYPGSGLPACFPFPLYQPERDVNNGGALTSSLAGTVTVSEYSPPVGSTSPDAASHNCAPTACPPRWRSAPPASRRPL
jgi:hypothetical protein